MRYIPEIIENDVILPLYTEELRDHLKNALATQQKEAHDKMKADGWGVTKFGEHNADVV